MIGKTIAVLFFSVTLAGCGAGMDAALQYEGTPLHDFDYGGHPWRIFDMTAESKLMITPSLGRGMGEGFVRGLTFGAVDNDIPKPEYQAVVQEWLKATHLGKQCSVTDGYKLVRPQWEFIYRCV